MTAAAEYDSADWTYIGVIAAPCDRNVLDRWEKVISGIKVDPSPAMTENGDPRMGGIGPGEFRFSWSRNRFDIATNIPRGEANRTKAGNLEMGKILANTAALFQDFA